MAAGLAVAQPADRAQLVDLLRQGSFEIGVVAAFGMVLPSSVLTLPRFGIVNVHFSLLPRWRGAAPVVAAISAGDLETGVTLMQMDEGLDTGPVIAAAPLVIGDRETGGALATRLAMLGAELVTANIDDWMSGRIEPVAQDPTRATWAPMVKANDRLLDLGVSAADSARRVRALAPRPGAVLSLDGVPHQVLAAEPVQLQMEVGEVRLVNDDLLVGLAKGALRLLTIQTPGGRPVDAASWLRGRRQPPTGAGGVEPLR